jgi:hypothetical protein
MELGGIAQKLKFKGLQNKAREAMDAIAAERGLSRDELEDCLVPDLGLDPRGGRAFDFGPRQFKLALDEDLRPMVADDTGRTRDDLPKPGAKDDAEEAAAAVAEWKLLKKQLRDVLKVQALRLEKAMVDGRRWPVAAFEARLVRQPLMFNLARRLLWEARDLYGQRLHVFRATDEQDYADVRDGRITLQGAAGVGVVHPLRLTEEERSAWGEVLGDYQVLPPFPQLGRPIWSLPPGKKGAKEFKDFGDTRVAPTKLWGTLEGAGWLRGSVGDNGYIDYHYRPFPGGEVTAVVCYQDGVSVGAPHQSNDQRIESVHFLPGVPAGDYNIFRQEKVPLAKVDPVALSEAVGPLTALVSKGA